MKQTRTNKQTKTSTARSEIHVGGNAASGHPEERPGLEGPGEESPLSSAAMPSRSRRASRATSWSRVCSASSASG